MGGTAGAIAAAQASQQDYTAGGGVNKAALLASAAVGGVVLKIGPGRLQRVLVTVSAAQSWTFYDANSTTLGSATVIGLIPASAAAGTIYSLRMPVSFGIVAVPSGTGTSALTVSFN
jgi:hypothetical protein